MKRKCFHFKTTSFIRRSLFREPRYWAIYSVPLFKSVAKLELPIFGWSQNQIFGQLRLTYITILTADAKYYRYWVIHFFFHNNIAIDSITKSKRFFIYLTWQLYNEIPLTLALSWKMENNGTGTCLMHTRQLFLGFILLKPSILSN